MPGTPVRVLLARHGETVFNVEGRWQGQSDSPLTPRGLAQARLLAEALSSEPIAAIYSSDLGRATQTAGEVARPHRLPVRLDTRLREIDVGLWTGRSRAEIEAFDASGLRTWATAPASMRLPNGETIEEAQQRALEFFTECMPAHLDQTIIVITHGAIGQAILIHAMGRPPADLWLRERLDNCQISRLEWTAEHGLHLLELCDVRHLADVGSLRNWRTTDADAAEPDPDVDVA